MSRKGSEILGCPVGTAQSKLRRNILFNLLLRFGLTDCFVCGKVMSNEDYSIEHIKPWLSSGSKELFWDLDNITFSHKKCNTPHIRPGSKPREVVGGKLRCYHCYSFKTFDEFSDSSKGRPKEKVLL